LRHILSIIRIFCKNTKTSQYTANLTLDLPIFHTFGFPFIPRALKGVLGFAGVWYGRGGEEDTQGFPFFFFAQKGKNRIFANYMTKIGGRP